MFRKFSHKVPFHDKVPFASSGIICVPLIDAGVKTHDYACAVIHLCCATLANDCHDHVVRPLPSCAERTRISGDCTPWRSRCVQLSCHSAVWLCSGVSRCVQLCVDYVALQLLSCPLLQGREEQALSLSLSSVSFFYNMNIYLI